MRAPEVSLSSSDAAPHVGELVALSADVTDDDTAPDCAAHAAVFTYAWSLVSVPAGSQARLNAPQVVAPSFVVDAPGSYVARVVVTDPTGRASEPVEIHVEADSCGGNPPAVGLLTSSPAEPAIGDTVTLGASVTDADTDPTCGAHDGTFEYAWSFSDLPPGSRARLNDENVEHPSFVADVVGTYALELVVSDPTGREASASVTVDVGDPSGGAPIPPVP